MSLISVDSRAEGTPRMRTLAAFRLPAGRQLSPSTVATPRLTLYQTLNSRYDSGRHGVDKSKLKYVHAEGRKAR